jgi:hypothetical protein
MRNAHCMTWSRARNTKKLGNEKCSLLDLEYDEKPESHGK